MNIGAWEKEFSQVIVARGLDYYEYGLVKEISRTENGFSAVVEGSDYYTVEIVLDDNALFSSASCSCPYAEDGRLCKHEAAVLYTIERDIEEESKREKTEDKDHLTLEDIVNSLSEKRAKELLLKAIRNDSSLLNEIIGNVRFRLPKRSRKIYVSALECVKEINMHLNGYDDFYDRVLNREVEKLHSLIFDDLLEMIKEKDADYDAFLIAIEILTHLELSKLKKRVADYSYYNITDNISTLLDDVFFDAEEEDKNEMIALIEKIRKDSIDPLALEIILDSKMEEVY